MDDPKTREPVSIPACLAHLEHEKRWVCWQFEERKGKVTKPPTRVTGGQASGYARNNDDGTWASLPEAMQALEDGQMSGIGLQLLGLADFAALDLDHVRNRETGTLLPWASDLVSECSSYCEITPSRSGLRILGNVSSDFASLHERRRHSHDGHYEIYANTTTGRYITVTGEKLPNAPDQLSNIDRPILSLLQTDPRRIEQLFGNGSTDDQIDMLLRKLPDDLKAAIARTLNSDRSKILSQQTGHATLFVAVAIGQFRASVNLIKRGI